jgi:hypothetical protein
LLASTTDAPAMVRALSGASAAFTRICKSQRSIPSESRRIE